MFDFSRPRNPPDALTIRITTDLHPLCAGTTVEMNVPVVITLQDVAPLTDIDIMVVDRAIILVKNGNGSGQLCEAEPFLPTLRDGSVNPQILVYNPSSLPLVVYCKRLGRFAQRGLQSHGIPAYGGGQTAAEKAARYQAFLTYVANL